MIKEDLSPEGRRALEYLKERYKDHQDRKKIMNLLDWMESSAEERREVEEKVEEAKAKDPAQKGYIGVKTICHALVPLDPEDKYVYVALQETENTPRTWHQMSLTKYVALINASTVLPTEAEQAAENLLSELLNCKEENDGNIQ